MHVLEHPSHWSLGGWVYTTSDIARILQLPQHKVRRWVSGYWKIGESGHRLLAAPVIDRGIWKSHDSRAMNFYALIEIFTFMALRGLGVSLQKIRQARTELTERFKTTYPFASHKLLCDGTQILVILEDIVNPMFLCEQGQIALKEIVEPFCQKIDFSRQTKLAEKYWPLGRNRAVIVDPNHGFGRPTILGTNITTETIASLVRAGEAPHVVTGLFNIDIDAVKDAVEF